MWAVQSECGPLSGLYLNCCSDLQPKQTPQLKAVKGLKSIRVVPEVGRVSVHNKSPTRAIPLRLNIKMA